jgi:hypothetical protein
MGNSEHVCFKIYGNEITINLISRDMQSDPGGKIIVLGGDIIGHCEEEKVHMNLCLILNGYRDKAL